MGDEMTNFRLDEMHDHLQELPRPGKVLFALSCAERLLPNYIAFSQKYGFGDSAFLDQALVFAWDNISENAPVGVDEIIQRCVELEPDTENFNTVYVSSALDATTAILCVLTLLKEDSLKSAMEAGIVARDTVDMYIQEKEAIPVGQPDLESIILKHPLMKQEIANQKTVISVIEKQCDVDLLLISKLKKQWRGILISNIGINREIGITDEL